MPTTKCLYYFIKFSNIKNKEFIKSLLMNILLNLFLFFIYFFFNFSSFLFVFFICIVNVRWIAELYSIYNYIESNLTVFIINKLDNNEELKNFFRNKKFKEIVDITNETIQSYQKRQNFNLSTFSLIIIWINIFYTIKYAYEYKLNEILDLQAEMIISFYSESKYKTIYNSGKQRLLNFFLQEKNMEKFYDRVIEIKKIFLNQKGVHKNSSFNE